jgi:hypothetical protein
MVGYSIVPVRVRGAAGTMGVDQSPLIYLNVEALKELKSDLGKFYAHAVPASDAKGSE